MDPDHRVSSSYKANLIFYNSGLERKEREKVFKEAGGIWDYDTFKKIMLERYEQKHELDCSMVESIQESWTICCGKDLRGTYSTRSY